MAEPAEDDPAGRSLNERLWDLLVFVPAGVAVSAAEELPRLAAKGREHLGVRVNSARAVGQFAVRAGRKELHRRSGGLIASDGPTPAPRRPPAGARFRRRLPRSAPGRPPKPRPPATASERNGHVPPVSTLAIPGFDTLSASQVVQRLDGLEPGRVGVGPDLRGVHPRPADHPQPGRPTARRAVLSPAARAGRHRRRGADGGCSSGDRPGCQPPPGAGRRACWPRSPASGAGRCCSTPIPGPRTGPGWPTASLDGVEDDRRGWCWWEPSTTWSSGSPAATWPTAADRRAAGGVLDACYVEPEARGVGMGRLLMEAAVAWLEEPGCAGVDGTALPGDRQAKNFFESAGFKARMLTMHRALG